MIYTIHRTHRKGKPLTRAERICSRIEADSPTQAITLFLSGIDRDLMRYYQQDTLVAEAVNDRKGAA